jgi:photosystem II stability/assembly factor-like uncharacterized protein
VDSVILTPSGSIIAGAENGIQRSSPGGGFQRVHEALAFAIKACSKDAIYAATYEKGLLRSTDDGRTWTPLTERQRLESHQKGYLTLTSISCLERGALLVGSFDDGVFFSGDAGLTWSSANAGLRSLYALQFAKDQGGTIYASGDGVYRLRGLPVRR